MTTTKPDHDALYHRFFSDPAVVALLLREFAAGPGSTASTSTAWSA